MFYSVIVPVFNRKKHIRRCLNSIIRQSFSDFEIIIVDDGSDDGTERICDEYVHQCEKVRVVHQKNSGVSVARNTGLKMAEGKFALFVDSDDYLPLNYLEQFVVAYEKFGMDFWYCTAFKIHTVFGVQYLQYNGDAVYSIAEAGDLTKLMDKILFNSVVNKVYELSLVKKYGIRFPENINLGEDLIFNLRYLDVRSELKFIVLNKNFYIGSWKDANESLERRWRQNYYEIQRKLLREKVKYINNWTKEKKISIDRKSVLKDWYYYCIRDSAEYYILHIKDMGILRLIFKMDQIRRSPEYDEYVQMEKEKKWILTQMIGEIIWTKLKDRR